MQVFHQVERLRSSGCERRLVIGDVHEAPDSCSHGTDVSDSRGMGGSWRLATLVDEPEKLAPHRGTFPRYLEYKLRPETTRRSTNSNTGTLPMHRPDYAGKRVLITGGLGFIGSSLAIELVESGADITVVDSMIPAYGANLFNVQPVRDRLHINYSDIRDQYSLEHLIREKEYIFNLAGQLSHIDSMRDPMTDLEINCSAQLSLLECLRRVNPEVKIVFGSTRQLYGRPQYLPVDEDHPIRPVDVNGINKWASESFFRLYHEDSWD